MKFKLKKNQSFYDYLFSIIDDTYNDLINKEFKEVFDRIDFKPKQLISKTFYQCYNKTVGELPRGYVSKMSVRDKFLEHELDITHYPLMAGYNGYIDEDNKFRLTALRISVNEDRFKSMIVDSLDTGMELFIEWIKVSVRHEVGHLMDYISMNGMNGDEYLELVHRRRKEKEDHNKKWDEHMHTDEITSEGESQRLREYFELEVEATANILANVDTKRMLEIDDAMAYHGNEFQTDLEINVKCKEFPNEE
jgi:hypothetical protein